MHEGLALQLAGRVMQLAFVAHCGIEVWAKVKPARAETATTSELYIAGVGNV